MLSLDRCPSGYRLFKDNMCGIYRSVSANHNSSGQSCQTFGDRLAVADDCRENVWLSYLAGQNQIHIAKNDLANEGTWVRDYGKLRRINAQLGTTRFAVSLVDSKLPEILKQHSVILKH